uniref:Uncharacterized protein n=1 Tax=Aegilops tauschii subsp. strangulata TaxID=200361 RepID=A0A453P4H0_AEGTS
CFSFQFSAQSGSLTPHAPKPNPPPSSLTIPPSPNPKPSFHPRRFPISSACRRGALDSGRRWEPPAVRSPPPSGDNRQVVQAEDISGEEVPSFAQVTEQPNMHLNTQSVMNHHHFGSTCQFASPPYQPPCRDTHSARIEADSVGASHVHPTSANQVPTGSTPGPRLAEDGLDSNHSPGASHVHPASANQVPTGSPPGPSLAEDGLDLNLFTIELSRLQKLADLMTKRHQEKIEQLNLAREVELAQAKRKYDELEYNLEVETLQRKRELKIKADKIYKQQILAEVLQVIFKASVRVVPDSPRGCCPGNHGRA